MKRREFVERLGLGSAAIAAGGALGHVAPVPSAAAQGHDHEQVTGPLASATISFGQWLTSPPTDRFPNLNPRTRNQHLLIPYRPTIKAGGSVNFVIAGLHHVLVYAPGTQTADIDTTSLIRPTTFPPPPPPPAPDLFFLIDDDRNRVYRGLDPTVVPQDRVEVVSLADPGTYLVICGFLPHFQIDNMHGFVRVVP
jgi:hypothetical protein